MNQRNWSTFLLSVIMVALVLTCLSGCRQWFGAGPSMLPTANMQVCVNGKVVVDQDDILEMTSTGLWEGYSTAVEFSFRPEATQRLRQATGDNIGKSLEVVVGSRRIMSKPITGPTDVVSVENSLFGNVQTWQRYFYGPGKVDVSRPWLPDEQERP